jgi:hypothetical protein
MNVFKGSPEGVPPLCYWGSQTVQCLQDGRSPLWDASSQGHDKVVALLLMAPGIVFDAADKVTIVRVHYYSYSPAFQHFVLIVLLSRLASVVSRHLVLIALLF